MSDRGRPTVLKFGGTSVQDIAALERAASITVAQRAARPVVTVSAMSGVTDALLAAVNDALVKSAKSPDDAVREHLSRYERAARHFLSGRERKAFLDATAAAAAEILRLLAIVRSYPCTAPPLRDEIVSFGERLCAQLFAGVLNEAGLPAEMSDARRCIVTDDAFSRATPLRGETFAHVRRNLSSVIERGVTPTLGGFIGGTTDGATTTLGRGGSDYTATLIGAALDAAEVQIWTDVSGILTADPRLVPQAKLLEKISYAEATDLALYGAKVLHPKTIEPVERLGIPVTIRNSHEPDGGRSTVSVASSIPAGAVGAVTHCTGIATLRLTPHDGSNATLKIGAVAETLEKSGVPAEHVSASRGHVEATVEAGDALRTCLRHLEAIGRISLHDRQAVVCLVGDFRAGGADLENAIGNELVEFEATALHPHPSQSARLFVTPEAHVAQAVRKLHRRFIETTSENSAERTRP
jgi:aspartate kinase